MKETIAAWEPQGRAVLRVIAAYMIFLHGLREVLGWFPARSRGPGSFMALDPLGPVGGYVLLVGAVLLFLGLFVRPAAAVLCIQALVAYFYAATPRGPWPVRNGGNETLTYAFVFLYLAVAGAGACSLDSLIRKKGTGAKLEPTSAAA